MAYAELGFLLYRHLNTSHMHNLQCGNSFVSFIFVMLVLDVLVERSTFPLRNSEWILRRTTRPFTSFLCSHPGSVVLFGGFVFPVASSRLTLHPSMSQSHTGVVASSYYRDQHKTSVDLPRMPRGA